MTWIEVPVRFVKDGEPNYQDLGVDIAPEFEIGEMLINLDRVDTINESSDLEETILRFNGASGDNCVWVQVKFSEIVKLLINGKEDSK